MRSLFTVIERNVSCALMLRPHGFYRRCNGPADSGVLMDDGNVYWRCPNHRGWQAVDPEDNSKPESLGHVVTEVAMVVRGA